MSNLPQADVNRALVAYGIAGAEVFPIPSGHIHRTFKVEAGGQSFVLQCVSEIFGPEVHQDIEAVTAHVARRGLLTPRLVRTQQGHLWTTDSSGQVWRLLTFVEGITHMRVSSPGMCRAAGDLVGRFHTAVDDLRHAFVHTRVGVHDTEKHLGLLRDTLAVHRDHIAHKEVSVLGGKILAAANRQPSMQASRPRVAHGDLKVSNILFSAQGEALCLVDLDTVGLMPRPVELGDAFRSWCSVHEEDAQTNAFELSLFEAGLAGYGGAARGQLDADEVRLLPSAIVTIALELAARFATDALRESYFAWDRLRYEAAWMHNLQRAKNQWMLAESVTEQLGKIATVVQQVV